MQLSGKCWAQRHSLADGCCVFTFCLPGAVCASTLSLKGAVLMNVQGISMFYVPTKKEHLDASCGQKFVDTWGSYPYVIFEHPILDLVPALL